MIPSSVLLKSITFLCLIFAFIPTAVNGDTITLSDPTGDGKYCKTFTTGVGACDYDTLKECKKDIRDSDEICLPNKIGAKGTPSKQVESKPVLVEKEKNSYKAPPNPLHLDSVIEEKDQKCYEPYPRGTVRWEIIQRLSDHRYELSGHYCLGYECESRQVHGVLVTTNKKFNTTGMITMPMKEIGRKRLPLDNGFSATYSFLELCGDQTEELK